MISAKRMTNTNAPIAKRPLHPHAHHERVSDPRSNSLPPPLGDESTGIATLPETDFELKPDTEKVPRSLHRPVEDHRVSPSLQVVNLLGVIVPMVALVAAIIMLWGVAFNWIYLGLMIGMYILTGLGITIGYHRLFTHKSFDTTPFGTWLFGVLGSMAAEGSVIDWVSWHRRHHQHSDEQGDPHSPYTHDHGDTLKGFFIGFWHSHIGWFVRLVPSQYRSYVPDLLKDPLVSRIDKQFSMWVGVGFLIPAVIGGLVTMTWMGALLGFIWGGLVRVFVVHHITWSINSVCHIWGSRDYESHDESRNNALFGILGFGEGWHNNHHAFPTSARHGLKWWQIDTSYLIIKAMSWVGLASNIKVPTPERMEAKRRKAA